MVHAISQVFADKRFIGMAVIIFVPMITGLLILSGHVFLEPYLTSHIPPGSEIGTILIIILSALSALVIPMSIFRIIIMRRIGIRKKGGSEMGKGITGSVVGVVAGACSCGPAGFAIISLFGSAGAAASAFLTYYEIPIRIGAVLLLVVTYFTTARALKRECMVN